MSAYPGQQPFGSTHQPQPPYSPYASQPQQYEGMAPPGGPSPYATSGPSRDDHLMAQFQAIASRYEISDFFARKLKQLEGWEIVLILDDSGSMNTPVQQGFSGGGAASPFARSITRWDELKATVGIIVDIGAVMDKDGLDIYFLNRATLHNVTSSVQLADVFAAPPAGLTPITPVLRHVLQAKKDVMRERKLLCIIATDGQPTAPDGSVDIATLKHVLLNERDINRCYVTFLACTDDDATVEYLNKWDRKIPHLDVVDDYHSERAEVLAAQGKSFTFTFGNYVVKTLLGAIDPEFDNLDEKPSCCALQ